MEHDYPGSQAGCGCPAMTRTLPLSPRRGRPAPAAARGAGDRGSEESAGCASASNWTAALLIAGVAVATGYFAHHAPRARPPAR